MIHLGFNYMIPLYAGAEDVDELELEFLPWARALLRRVVRCWWDWAQRVAGSASETSEASEREPESESDFPVEVPALFLRDLARVEINSSVNGGVSVVTLRSIGVDIPSLTDTESPILE